MEYREEIRAGRIINLFFYAHPKSPTTLFFIHGLGGRAEQWREQIESLKNHYSLVIPDLFGHGNSDKPNTDAYDFNALDLDLQAIFSKYATEKNVVIGHSYGGALATSLAIDHQDKVAKLILISPLPCEPAAQIPWLFKLPVFLMTLLRPYLDKQFQQAAFAPQTNPALLQQELTAAQQNKLYVIRSMIHGMKSMPRLDMTMLTVPTLLILGKHDGIVPQETSKKFYSAIPYHQFALISQAGHLSMLEAPQQVNKLIEAFIAADDAPQSEIESIFTIGSTSLS